MTAHLARRSVLFVAALGIAPSARAQASLDSAAAGQVELVWGVKIPTRDGIKLNATIYRPKRQREPLPVVFWLTPYIADLSHARGMYFAQHGYVFAVIDTRGRGNSEGVFEPFAHEARDGYDIVEWFARQPYSNGKVAMWGGSYGGFDQWAAAKERPPHLVTIAPVASANPGVDFPALRNIYRSYAIQWATYTSGVTPQLNLFSDAAFWTAKYLERYREHRAYAALDTIAGNLSTVFQKWLEHRTEDGYWNAMKPSPAEFAAIDLPILTITGYFDGDQVGALTYYRRHLANASPAARSKHYLILGPWDHPGTRTPVKAIGGLTFADTSVLDLNALHTRWYDWTMKGGSKPAFLERRVVYYVMGAERWRYADSLEGISNGTLQLRLDSDGGRANEVYHSGFLRAVPARGGEPDSYLYDPLDLRPAELELHPRADYFKDQTGALNLMGNGLVYHTDPFAEATEITGIPRLTVWISTDVPDTDFEITLDELFPDGSTIRLSDDALRARYRDSPTEAHPMVPGTVTRFVFRQGMFFSREIAKGSRLRLVIRSPNSMAWEKNYNSGGEVARESARDARPAHIRLYHDPEHPSTLELPVVRNDRNRTTP